MDSVFQTMAEMSALTFAGYLSGVLSTFAYLPYVLDTLARRTRPKRASWLIWSVLGAIAFFSQVHEGADESLWFAGAQVSGTIAVFLLAVVMSGGRFLSRIDAIVLVLAGLGLMLWYYTNDAAYALGITVGISLLGGLVTVAKAFREPDTETMATWAMSCAASLLAILSVGKSDPVLLAYPVYLFILNGGIVLAILLGRAVRRPGRTVTVGA